MSIKSLLNATGKRALKLRMREVKARDIPDGIARAVKDKLKRYEMKQIVESSEGALIFYLWVRMFCPKVC